MTEPYAPPMTTRLLLCAALLLAACASPPGPTLSEDPHWIDMGDGSRLYVEIYGTGQETVVVPLAVWFAPDLSTLAVNRRVIFYGLRGRSRSTSGERKRIGLDADVAELEAVRQAFGLERFSILGWSYLAGVAANYVALHPEHVEKLVLVAPIPPRKEPVWDVFAERLKARIDPEELARLEHVLADEELLERKPDLAHRRFLAAYMPAYVSDPNSLGRMQSRPWSKLDPRPDRAAAWQERVHVGLGDWDWRELAHGIERPVLVVQGEDDPMPIASGRAWVEALADGSLLELEGVGHLPWLEDPFVFFMQVESFLGDGLSDKAILGIAEAVSAW